MNGRSCCYLLIYIQAMLFDELLHLIQVTIFNRPYDAVVTLCHVDWLLLLCCHHVRALLPILRYAKRFVSSFDIMPASLMHNSTYFWFNYNNINFRVLFVCAHSYWILRTIELQFVEFLLFISVPTNTCNTHFIAVSVVWCVFDVFSALGRSLLLLLRLLLCAGYFFFGRFSHSLYAMPILWCTTINAFSW